MKLAYLPLALLAATASAWGQDTTREPLGVRVRLAYGISSSFDASSGSGTVKGPEVAVALPIGTLFGRELLLEPSFFGGGRLLKGNDNDADIYRLTAFLHQNFANNLGLRAGVGFATSTKARGGGFGATSDIIFDFGVEIPLKLQKVAQYGPYIDVHGIVSPTDRLGGFFLGVGAKL